MPGSHRRYGGCLRLYPDSKGAQHLAVRGTRFVGENHSDDIMPPFLSKENMGGSAWLREYLHKGQSLGGRLIENGMGLPGDGP